VKLVETDADRPEDESEPAPVVTSSRPEKRRAYASLIFTLAVLTGTVVTIYTVFPARAQEATKLTVAAHRRAAPKWQLEAPSRPELEAWTMGLLGRDAPLPADGADLLTIGARPIEILRHQAAFVRFRIDDGYEVSYLVQRASDAPADRDSYRDGADQVEAWHAGPWTVIAIGPADQAERWRARVGVP
jgi:hypothetical protein